ncbi:uncharacterized protein LOC120076742 isoform X1 [Benincasa hispida]|uniref:uncharacterized protein LOC120076681 isoform X2 n=1 Tax=Benincasa hispida TaxID=102211 RepID=UPI0018FF39AD|nr:uncharacterized protein LOC120076681 isoform X2 [Benincasa hispida]XP_038886571.1 uncharacterized protein LOC120076742 isoform X1 [Benincasa hispida]
MSIISISSSSTFLRSTNIQSHRRRHGSNLNTTHILPFPTTTNPKYSTSCRHNIDMAIYSSGDANGLPPLPPLPDTPWPLWVAGVLMSAVLSIWQTKSYWGPFLTLKEKVDKVVDVVEEVAEMVETAAERVDKVAEEIAEHLPEGSKLQKAALFVENAAERIAKDADLAGDIIDKCQGLRGSLSHCCQRRDS